MSGTQSNPAGRARPESSPAPLVRSPDLGSGGGRARPPWRRHRRPTLGTTCPGARASARSPDERDHDVGQARASSARGPPAGPGRRWRISSLLLAAHALSAGARGLDQGEFQIAFQGHAAWCDRPVVPPAPTRAATSPSPTPSSPARRICARLTLRNACLPLFKSARQLVHARLGSIRRWPAYVHQDFVLENYPDESKPGPLSRPSSAVLHRKAVASISPSFTPTRSKGRPPKPLQRHFRVTRPPSTGHSSAEGTTRTSPIHPNPHRPRDAARHQINSRNRS